MKTIAKLWAVLLAVTLFATLGMGCKTTTTDATAVPTAAATETPATTATAAPTIDPNLTPWWGLDKSEYYLIQILRAPSGIWDKYSETQVGQVILDKFNIDFECVAYTGTTVEHQQLLLAGGDYYEIMTLETAPVRQAYMEAGAVVSLEPYLDRMTNFTRVFEASLPYYRASAPDGQIYYWQDNKFPIFVQSATGNKHGFLVRADAVELYAQEYGWDDPPLYLDDYIELIEMAVEAGLTDVNGKKAVGLTVSLGEPWDLELGMIENNGDTYANCTRTMIYSFEEERWMLLMETPVAKEQYEFFNKLYNKGLLDEECFTDLAAQSTDKMKTASAVAVYYMTWLQGSVNTFIAESGHPEMQYANMPRTSAVTGPLQGKKLLLPVWPTADFTNTVITTEARYPERIAELVDFLYSDEGAFLNFNGIEGVHWEYDDEGKRVFIDADYIRRTDKDDPTYDEEYANMVGLSGVGSMCGVYPVINAADGYPQAISYCDYHIAKWLDTESIPNKILDNYGWTGPGTILEQYTELFVSDIPSSITLEAGSELDIIDQELLEIRLHHMYNIMTSPDFESAWNLMMEEYYASDYQLVVDEFNRLSDEIIARAKQN